METAKKFVWKGHGKEKMQKRVVQLCTLTKISSEIGVLSVNWAKNSFSYFYFLPLKIVISCLAPGISTLYLSNIPGKSKSWNSQFRDFT